MDIKRESIMGNVSERQTSKKENESDELYVKMNIEFNTGDRCYVLNIGSERNPDASRIELPRFSEEDRDKIMDVAKQISKESQRAIGIGDDPNYLEHYISGKVAEYITAFKKVRSYEDDYLSEDKEK